MSAQTLEALPGNKTRRRAQLSLSVHECISITRDIALVSLALFIYHASSCIRLSFHPRVAGIKVARLQRTYFQLPVGKTLRTSTESVVVSADSGNQPPDMYFQGRHPLHCSCTRGGPGLRFWPYFPDFGRRRVPGCVPSDPPSHHRFLAYAHLREAGLRRFISPRTSSESAVRLVSTLQVRQVDETMKLL